MKNIAVQKNESFAKDIIAEVVRFGGDITCDCLKQKYTNATYYDFTLHYIRVGLLRGEERKVDIICPVLMVKEHTDPEGAVSIGHSLESALRTELGLDFETFMKDFTLVSDCASTLPCVVGHHREVIA